MATNSSADSSLYNVPYDSVEDAVAAKNANAAKNTKTTAQVNRNVLKTCAPYTAQNMRTVSYILLEFVWFFCNLLIDELFQMYFSTLSFLIKALTQTVKYYLPNILYLLFKILVCPSDIVCERF